MTGEMAAKIVADALGERSLEVILQSGGERSVTYEAVLSHRSVIVRASAETGAYAGTERNLTALRELGLPVPTILTADLSLAVYPFAFLVLPKLPGRELRHELASLSLAQMTRLAEQIADYQQRVWTLPPGMGYGYVSIGERGRFASWWDLLHADSELKLDEREEIRRLFAAHETYLRQVPPTCFLDDITVKNVLILNGELQGLIDFDGVCYGDPLYWLGLTTVGVVCDVGTAELFYVDELSRCLGLTEEQKRVVALYAAGIGTDFIARFADRETPEWRARMTESVATWKAQARE